MGEDWYRFVHHKWQDYLIVVDYFSNFWEIDHLPNTTASTVIKKLKCHFARQGIPDIVISDNGPQFACEKFSNFAKEWGFEHRPGSPGHQQTNGKAEAAVKEAKRLLRKAKDTKGDLYLAVLAHRNTPTESMGTSPAQRLLGQRCKTQLPTTKELLMPQCVRAETVKRKMQAKQASSVLQQRNAWPFPLRRRSSGQDETIPTRKKSMGTGHGGKKTWRTFLWSWDGERDLPKEQGRPSRAAHTTEVPTADTTSPTTSEQTPSDTPNKNQEKIQAGANSTQEASVQSGANQQVVHAPVAQRPKRTIREPAYFKDYLH